MRPYYADESVTLYARLRGGRMRLLATIRPETRDPERYQCLRCGIWRVKKSGRSTRYCIDCLSVEPTLRRPS